MKTIFTILLSLTVLILVGCGSSDDTTENLDDIPLDSILTDDALEISEGAMEEIIQNISSPVEMAALIKAVGVPFSKQYLCPTENIEDYNTNFKKALGLGIMGADLGYLNIYSRTSQVVTYITAIKKLADGIKVGQFFDFATLKRLATNNENIDSLMYISVNSFNRMDAYLRENKRSDLSALIVTGVWIEGMYLATQVVKEKPNKDIAERIGEQKVILDELLLILKNYKSNEDFADLIKDIEDIQSAFEGVEILYEVGEPETVERDGKLVIIQNETSVVKINEEQLSEIIAKVARVRKKVTNL